MSGCAVMRVEFWASRAGFAAAWMERWNTFVLGFRGHGMVLECGSR